ncbi:MAG: potassium-transporting ATPase subunit KdpA [Acidobacteria bacterium]|jgi:K+-transporting ATPase ATPase A chain|nr:potassium-transporting ATPase subunit KdpA [Acidobacteriota bacterium]
MNANGVLQIALYLVVLTACSRMLGRPIARALDGERSWLTRALGPLERLVYRLAGADPAREMTWMEYALAFLLFNAAGTIALYALLRVQGFLPLNPDLLPGLSPHLAFNTATSFATNTNWQSYGGETTISALGAMLGLTVQNFVSAAAGIAVLLALVRGIVRRSAGTIGNFWADLVRGSLYVLLPLSLLLAVALVSQGVVQTLAGSLDVPLLQPAADAQGQPVVSQRLALGPVASQIAIKQLGTNGGGYYNVNSAHPFENPTPLSNFLELLAILLIPAALCFSFGHWVKEVRQGWALYAAMLVLLGLFLALAAWSEAQPNPGLAGLGVDEAAAAGNPGGNMEGKEVRFGIAGSATWAAATTAASNGSVNSMHDSFNPLGGLAAMTLMAPGEVAFGGVGSGLYGMLLFVIVTVFISGLMVGRTPEYLGKKIESYETKMAALGILVSPIAALVGTAVAVSTAAGAAGVANPGPHGFSEILYAFLSAANNNGSAFAGLSANAPFYDTALGLCMLFGRYFIVVPVLAIAGSLAAKKFVPPSTGTLPTHTPLFVTLLVGVVLIVGALNFVPAFALGPIVEQLQLVSAGH